MGGIRAILKETDGVLNYEVTYHMETRIYDVILSFDDRKTSLETILNTLARKGFRVRGEPGCSG